VTIRRGRDVLDNIHISDLPTCLVDLVRRTSSQAGVAGTLAELDLANLNVTLELLCVTLPTDMTLPYKVEASNRSVSISSRFELKSDVQKW
jgi:hypothetical protein